MDMERKKEKEAIGVCQKLYEFLMNKISLHGMKRVTLGRSSSNNKKAQDERVVKNTKKVGFAANDPRRKEEVKKVKFVDGEVKIERKPEKKLSAVDVPVEGSELDIEEKLKYFLGRGRESF